MKPRLGLLILFIYSLFQSGCYENLTFALPAKGKVNTFPNEPFHSSTSFSFLSLNPDKKESIFPAPKQSEVTINLKGEIKDLSQKSIQYMDDLLAAQPTYLISKADLSHPSSSCFDLANRFFSEEGMEDNITPSVFELFPEDKQTELLSSYKMIKDFTQKEQLRASTLENSPDIKLFFASFIHPDTREDFFHQFLKRIDQDQLLEVCKSNNQTYFTFLRSEADTPDRLMVTYWDEQARKLEEFMGFGPISNAFFKLIPHVAEDRALVFVASGKNQNFGWQFYLLYPNTQEAKKLEACNGYFRSGHGDGTNFFEFECSPEYSLVEPL